MQVSVLFDLFIEQVKMFTLLSSEILLVKRICRGTCLFDLKELLFLSFITGTSEACQIQCKRICHVDN